MPTLLHIAHRPHWADALENGAYSGDTLATQGFIHLCEPQQLAGVTERYYLGQQDLLILVIDPAKLHAELIYEPSTNDELFPHLYGALNLNAVTQVLDYPCNADGSFTPPNGLS
jgi:uncharacterized protein (DUF952 family)